MKKTTVFRKMLDNYKQKMIIAPGVHDPYAARIAEKIGYEILYMSGASTSMSRLGMADIGLMTSTEIQMNAKSITSVTKSPLLCDSDTGYGNAINVMRTIRDYISAGVSGVHIEDQTWPKRCGHLKGKTVISKEEMIGRIKAAKETIEDVDPDFILVGRTDIRNALNGTMDKAIDRLNSYLDAGADIVFADGLISKEEVKRMTKEVNGPTLYHPTGMTPRLTLDECKEIGVAILIYPFASFHAMAISVWDFLADLKERNTYAQIDFENSIREHPLGDLRKLFDLAGLEEFEKMEKRLLPEEQTKMRYEKTIGL